MEPAKEVMAYTLEPLVKEVHMEQAKVLAMAQKQVFNKERIF